MAIDVTKGVTRADSEQFDRRDAAGTAPFLPAARKQGAVRP